MIKLFRALKASLILSKAIDYASKGKYSDAQQKMDALSDLVLRPDAEISLLNAFLSYKTNKYKTAVALVESALGNIKNEAKFNDDEKNYLVCYAMHLYKRALEKLNETDMLANLSSLKEYCDVDEQKVSAILIRRFPLNYIDIQRDEDSKRG